VNSRNQSFLVYFLLIVAIAAMFYMGFRQDGESQDVLTINQLAQDIQAGKVGKVTVKSDDKLQVVYQEGTEKQAQKETGATLVEQLVSLGVTPQQLSPENNDFKLVVEPPSSWVGILSSVVYILPVLLMGGVLWFIFRQAQGSNNQAMAFGKSRARMFSGDHPTVTFADVAGVEEEWIWLLPGQWRQRPPGCIQGLLDDFGCKWNRQRGSDSAGDEAQPRSVL